MSNAARPWMDLLDAAARWRAGGDPPSPSLVGAAPGLDVGLGVDLYGALHDADVVGFQAAAWAAAWLAAGPGGTGARCTVLRPVAPFEAGDLPDVLASTLPGAGWTLRMLGPVPTRWSADSVAAVLSAWQARVRRGLASRSGLYDDGELRFEVSLAPEETGRDPRGAAPRMRVGRLDAREAVEALERLLGRLDPERRVAIVWVEPGAEIPRGFWEQLWYGRAIASESWRDGARRGRRARFASSAEGLFRLGWSGVALMQPDGDAVQVLWSPNPWIPAVPGAPFPGATAGATAAAGGVLVDFPVGPSRWAPGEPPLATPEANR